MSLDRKARTFRAASTRPTGGATAAAAGSGVAAVEGAGSAEARRVTRAMRARKATRERRGTSSTNDVPRIDAAHTGPAITKAGAVGVDIVAGAAVATRGDDLCTTRAR